MGEHGKVFSLYFSGFRNQGENSKKSKTWGKGGGNEMRGVKKKYLWGHEQCPIACLTEGARNRIIVGRGGQGQL